MNLFIPNPLLDYMDLRVCELPLKEILIFIYRFFIQSPENLAELSKLYWND